MNTFTFSIYIISPLACARISYSPAAPLPQQSPATPCSANAPASAATCFKEEFACGSGECVSKVSCDWSTQWMLSSDWPRTTCATAPMTARTTLTRPDAGSWRGCSSGGDSLDYVTKTCTNIINMSCVREAGFKLEGVTGEVESESVAASVEDCAKLCLYQKSAETGGR